MEIIIQGVIGEGKSLAVNPTDSLQSLQSVIQSILGVPVAHQKIVYYGKVLTDKTKKLYEYYISHKDVLVIFRSANPQPLKSDPKQQHHRFEIEEEEKVEPHKIPPSLIARKVSPPGLSAGNSDPPLGIKGRKEDGSGGEKRPGPPLSRSDKNTENVKQLLKKGYSQEKIRIALVDAGGDLQVAEELLQARSYKGAEEKKSALPPKDPVFPIFQAPIEEETILSQTPQAENEHMKMEEEAQPGPLKRILVGLVHSVINPDRDNTELGDAFLSLFAKTEEKKVSNELTSEDREKIKRLTYLGFDESECTRSYLQHGKDLVATSNALLERIPKL